MVVIDCFRSHKSPEEYYVCFLVANLLRVVGGCEEICCPSPLQAHLGDEGEGKNDAGAVTFFPSGMRGFGWGRRGEEVIAVSRGQVWKWNWRF